jgi:pyruvate formate lyase activating enzyme
MNIGGFEKYSFIDYPGCISSVVFTVGCNFHCPYCHNPELVRPGSNGPAGRLSQSDILAFLEKRRKYLDGVVITGGEPTLQPDLQQFCREVKSLGLSVKLDTNGSNPSALAALVSGGLVDYIAMDIKTDPDHYVPLISHDINPQYIKDSIRIILESGLPHEFRTTCVIPMVDSSSIRAIARLVQGADLYALQKPHFDKILDSSFFSGDHRACLDEEMLAFQQILSASVKKCMIR